jgi:hypothetical protein
MTIERASQLDALTRLKLAAIRDQLDCPLDEAANRDLTP